MSEAPPVTEASAAATTTMLRVEDAHVRYRVHTDRPPTLRERVTGARRAKPTYVEAVRGVTLDVASGDILGIIGGNGAGKSTLMRAMAGLLPPHRGRVVARSRPVLLGVGAALKPQLSGRRNIMLGLLALGMTRAEAEQLAPDVRDFAELDAALDRPLKTYSTGMKARLHFAIATTVAPEILLVDEALSVGDQSFKEKSAARLQELKERAGAVVLVSHSLDEVAETCNRVCWMRDGEIVMDGGPDEVVAAYRKTVPSKKRKKRAR